MQRRHCGLVFRLVLLMSITTVTTPAGQWTDTYDVSGPYSGPTQFGGTRNQDRVRIRNPSNNSVIGSGSAIPLTAQQLIGQAAPYPDQITANDYLLIWTNKVGDYYVVGNSGEHCRHARGQSIAGDSGLRRQKRRPSHIRHEPELRFR